MNTNELLSNLDKDARRSRLIFKIIAYGIIVLVACLMFFALPGCNVYMSPEYQATVADAAEAINGLNENCQAGDPNACRLGLAEAAKTVNMILEASYGR